MVAHPGRRDTGRRLRGDLGVRRGPGSAAGVAAATVPQARRHDRRQRTRDRDTAWAGHLQRAGGGARGPHSAESGRARRGTQFTFAIPVAEQAGGSAAGSAPSAPAGSPKGGGILIYSADAAVRAGGAHPGRLRPSRDRRPAAAIRPRQDAQAPLRAARPTAPGTDGFEFLRAPELAELPVSRTTYSANPSSPPTIFDRLLPPVTS